MAQNRTKTLLGFEDEIIGEKYKNQVLFTTNKIGGKPDLPNNVKFDFPLCPLCQLPTPLIVQLYAPLENSVYHRNLYLFACINANCWNHPESWLCIRIQSQDKLIELEVPKAAAACKTSATDWCADADDWDDNNANFSEENGNVINNFERVSDEDDESCSFDESARIGLGNLTIDDRNANNGAFGAAGKLNSPAATAELEGDEGEVISIDSPTMPQSDLISLLQEATPLPRELLQDVQPGARQSSLEFVSSFMAVWEEASTITNIPDIHVKDLLQEYQQNSGDDLAFGSPEGGGASAQITDTGVEKYEKSNPAHGDKMFHHFLSTIQMNPGQILRYNRDNDAPILIYPLQSLPNKCNYCQGDLVFEFQLLPTIIRKLRLIGDAEPCSRLEFGTILVFTCRKSCWSTDTNFRQESIVLQKEVY